MIRANATIDYVEDLKGKIALVTGVGRPEGIGAAVCRKLAEEGVDIFYTYWYKYDIQEYPETKNPKALLEELQGFSVRAESMEIDLSQLQAPSELFKEVGERLGAPDILINNACYDRAIPFESLTADVLDSHYYVNLRAAAMLCVEFVKAWKKETDGRIINMTSGQTLGPMNVDQIPYTVTKASLEMLARQLSPGIIDLGITINAVDPGPTDTGWMSKELKEQIRRNSIVNQPQDVAVAIASLLLSPTTGDVIHVGR